ncbi:MAG: alkaline phosphatase family protein [Cellulomonas sp.]|nr:alkaline phosphatase family protein [Cellulomonas sp.]NMM31259.1 alkaline phosphatase family protein [Cellulomonas sp.]
MTLTARQARAGRPTLADAWDTAGSLVATALGLGAGIAIVDGAHASHPLAILAVALVVAVGDLVLRAPLRLFARAAGAMGALVAGLAAQVLVAWVALTHVPGIVVDSGVAVVAVLLIASLVMAVGRWLWGVNDTEYVLGDVIRRAQSRARRAGTRPDGASVVPGEPMPRGTRVEGRRPPGLLVVQLDGVAAPVLALAVEAGLAPTVARWLASGSHCLDPWWSRVPATTPASQAAILHGDSSGIPAFRWWDRDLGRLVVTNHPADAALVESTLPAEHGLLAPDGAAVSTMFSGGAATNLLVMSRSVRAPDGSRGGFGPGPAFLRFFASPFVFTRAVVRSVAEMAKELYQARRQRVRGVEPRVSRGGWFVVLRGVTNGLMRDLTTSLVAEHLVRGTPTVFVDLVDYDEIAHHAGPTRPEALRALEGLDGVLHVIEQVLPVAARDYQVVVLSDHGQSLGATFEQVEGRSLLEVVRSLMADPDVDGVQAVAGEEWGPLNSLLTSASLSSRPRGTVMLGPDAPSRGVRAGRPERVGLPDVVVTGSGNLGLVWFPSAPARLVLEDLQERWPGLVAGLAGRPGIGAVVVDTASRGLVAVGARGLALLELDVAPEGEDPLAGWGSQARADLARAGRLEHTGDLLVISAITPGGHVHAFEGQVGSHGGLGGDQNRALLLHPSGLVVDADLLGDVDGSAMLVGAEQVHIQLLRWSAALGLRA